MDEDQRERIKDFFDGFELVEYLRIPIEDILERFEAEIEEAIDDIEELMGVKNG